MNYFGVTDCHGSLLHVTEEQPKDPVHLNAQALLGGFEDGGPYIYGSILLRVHPSTSSKI
jgi:hypothetical protein